jgi:N-ethylmaleimide reductase
MAALTRGRADIVDAVPNDLHVEYYAARADAGLILSECSQISLEANCFPGAVGIHTDAQVAGWKRVTDAVHEKGSKILL